jgi:hypothetical protein
MGGRYATLEDATTAAGGLLMEEPPYMGYWGDVNGYLVSLRKIGPWGGFHGVFTAWGPLVGWEIVSFSRLEVGGRVFHVVGTVDRLMDTVEFWLAVGGRYGHRISTETWATGDDLF